MNRFRPGLLIAFIVLAVVAIASAVYFYSRGAGSPPPVPGSTQTGSLQIGGPFALTAQDGRRVTDRDFRGRHMLVYFGYTHCPDMCPLGLETVTQALDAMPPDLAAKVQPLFVTVDPARDTPEIMREYAAHFHPRLLALTGSEEDVAAMLKAYRVYAGKAGDHHRHGSGGGAAGSAAAGSASADYAVDHSAFTYVMGPDGYYVAHFSHGTGPEEMAKRLAAIVGGGAAAATS